MSSGLDALTAINNLMSLRRWLVFKLRGGDKGLERVGHHLFRRRMGKQLAQLSGEMRKFLLRNNKTIYVSCQAIGM